MTARPAIQRTILQRLIQALLGRRMHAKALRLRRRRSDARIARAAIRDLVEAAYRFRRAIASHPDYARFFDSPGVDGQENMPANC